MNGGYDGHSKCMCKLILIAVISPRVTLLLCWNLWMVFVVTVIATLLVVALRPVTQGLAYTTPWKEIPHPTSTCSPVACVPVQQP